MEPVIRIETKIVNSSFDTVGFRIDGFEFKLLKINLKYKNFIYLFLNN